jgi:uncharacterized coiled-coil DUF342 family protein
MSRANKALVVAIVSAFGLWGCAQSTGSATVERARVLEERVAKLEEECQAAAAARDEFREKLELQMNQLAQVLKERDNLRKQVEIRTAERDTAQVQYEQFRKSIRDLLSGADAAANSAPAPSTVRSAVKDNS